MQRTIHAIVHPFFLRQLQGRNLDFYKRIIDGFKEDPNSLLLFISTGPNVRRLQSEESALRLVDYSDDIELEDYLRSLPEEAQSRIAFLTEDDGDESWYVDSYRPRAISAIAQRPDDSSLSWFARNRAKTYYDPSLHTAFIDVTGIEGMPAVGLVANSSRSFHRESSREYLRSPLHPQIAKLIRLLGVGEEEVVIDDEKTLAIPDRVAREVRIVGSGEFLEACVFDEAIGLSLLLGTPIRNVSLNLEQPYLSSYGGEGFIHKKPIETLYPQESRRESFLPASKR